MLNGDCAPDPAAAHRTGTYQDGPAAVPGNFPDLNRNQAESGQITPWRSARCTRAAVVATPSLSLRIVW